MPNKCAVRLNRIDLRKFSGESSGNTDSATNREILGVNIRKFLWCGKRTEYMTASLMISGLVLYYLK